MQCRICGYENLPGHGTCLRCGSRVLPPLKTSWTDYLPPKAGRGKRLRPILYALRSRLNDLPVSPLQGILTRLAGDVTLSPDAVRSLLLSFIPGLGHLASGQPAEAAVWFLLWGFALLLKANFYVGLLGGLLSGCLVGLHAAVLFHAARLHDHAQTMRERLRLLTAVLVPTAAMYALLGWAVHQFIEFGRASTAIDELGIDRGDTLIARRAISFPRGLSRGDLVLIRINRMGHVAFAARRGTLPGGSWSIAARVIGLPGDRIEAAPEGLLVNGSPVSIGNSGHYKIPLPPEAISMEVPHGSLMAVFPVRVREDRLSAINLVWSRLFLIQRDEFRGKVFGIYLPLHKRRILPKGRTT